MHAPDSTRLTCIATCAGVTVNLCAEMSTRVPKSPSDVPESSSDVPKSPTDVPKSPPNSEMERLSLVVLLHLSLGYLAGQSSLLSDLALQSRAPLSGCT
eukprot:2297578-Rhodomonas_salina.5